MTGEAQMLRDLVARVVADHPGEAVDGGVPPAWGVLCQLGVDRIGVSDEDGGNGGSLADVVELVRALGRHGVSTPLITASTANWLIGRSAGLADRLATVAIADGWGGEGETLTADLGIVPWATAADVLVCCGNARAAVLVDLSGPGVRIDRGANVAGEQRDRVVLDGAPLRRLEPVAAADEVRARLGLLWAAALVGAAAGAYALTAEFVREREQFGAPLLKLPAVASGLAEMRVELIQADAALERALEGRADAVGAVGVARVIAAGAATRVAALAHQLHGAMGMTEEYTLHRFSRRLWAWRDAETSEADWAYRLGDRALADGEPGVWERHTA